MNPSSPFHYQTTCAAWLFFCLLPRHKPNEWPGKLLQKSLSTPAVAPRLSATTSQPLPSAVGRVAARRRSRLRRWLSWKPRAVNTGVLLGRTRPSGDWRHVDGAQTGAAPIGVPRCQLLLTPLGEDESCIRQTCRSPSPFIYLLRVSLFIHSGSLCRLFWAVNGTTREGHSICSGATFYIWLLLGAKDWGTEDRRFLKFSEFFQTRRNPGWPFEVLSHSITISTGTMTQHPGSNSHIFNIFIDNYLYEHW